MLDMGEPIRIVDLAHDLIRLSNHAEDEIPIVFTGLRPGEKLFEEIHLQGESIHPTVHPHIVITAESMQAHDRITTWLQRTSFPNSDDCIAALRQLVPEYLQAEPPSAEQSAETQETISFVPPNQLYPVRS
jgi:FlaA1/EpsC-like NDP-sugar epimerase